MPASDYFSRFRSNSSLRFAGPWDNAVAIVHHNTNEQPVVTQGIYVGVTGDVKVTTTGGQATVFKAVPAGAIIPVRAKIVWATGTTATDLVALY